ACPRQAIRVDRGLRVDEARCDRCGQCTRACVVARYYDRLTGVRQGEMPPPGAGIGPFTRKV
ncbi:MAG TPA: hypothetical protein VLT35_01655, partial [Methanocella sp.]|nr:hypothetical protein [Methanocella sp.]